MLYPPCKLKAKVPLVVMGLPEIASPVGTVISTEVTVPAPPLIPRVEVAVQPGNWVIGFIHKTEPFEEVANKFNDFCVVEP